MAERIKQSIFPMHGESAFSVLLTTYHSTPAQNDVVGWVLLCCTRDVFNAAELPVVAHPKSSVIWRRTLHCTTQKENPLCNTIVLVKHTLVILGAFNIAVEVGATSITYHCTEKNCTRESTYHCTAKTVFGRAPTIVLAKLYLGEQLPLYWGNCTRESTYHCTGETVLGRAPTTVLGKLYLGEHLPLYWGNCTWESTYHCTGETVLGRAPTTVLGKLY